MQLNGFTCCRTSQGLWCANVYCISNKKYGINDYLLNLWEHKPFHHIRPWRQAHHKIYSGKQVFLWSKWMNVCLILRISRPEIPDFPPISNSHFNFNMNHIFFKCDLNLSCNNMNCSRSVREWMHYVLGTVLGSRLLKEYKSANMSVKECVLSNTEVLCSSILLKSTFENCNSSFFL